MNIFFLDKSPELAAQYHCDKHVVKMCLETAQILCSVCHRYGVPAQYKQTHKNHPCVLWAGQNTMNFLWTASLGIYLCKEYSFRYRKKHKCDDIISQCVYSIRKLTESGLLMADHITPPAQAINKECYSEDAVEAYRRYYKEVKLQKIKCVWTRRGKPKWLEDSCLLSCKQ